MENESLKVSQLKAAEAIQLQAELAATRAEMEALKHSLSQQTAETNRLRLEQAMAANAKLELEQVARAARVQAESEAIQSAALLQARLEATELAVQISEEAIQSLEAERAELARKAAQQEGIQKDMEGRLRAAEAALRIQVALREDASSGAHVTSRAEDSDEDDDASSVDEEAAIRGEVSLLTAQLKTVQISLKTFTSEIEQLGYAIDQAKSQLARQMTTVNFIKKDQEVLSQEDVLKKDKEARISRRVAAEEQRLEAQSRDQLLEQAAKERSRAELEAEHAAAVQRAAAQAVDAAEEANARETAERKRRTEEAARRRVEQQAVLQQQIDAEEGAVAEDVLLGFDLEVLRGLMSAVAEQAVLEVKQEEEDKTAVRSTAPETIVLVKGESAEEEATVKMKERAPDRVVGANYEVTVIRHLGTKAEAFFTEEHKECIHACWSMLRDGIRVSKYTKGEGGNSDRYLHVDLVWTKLYWRNKLAREDDKTGSSRPSLFGKNDGHREVLLSDITCLKRHATLPHSLELQCELKNRSFVFEINPRHFELLEKGLQLVLEFIKLTACSV